MDTICNTFEYLVTELQFPHNASIFLLGVLLGVILLEKFKWKTLWLLSIMTLTCYFLFTNSLIIDNSNICKNWQKVKSNEILTFIDTTVIAHSNDLGPRIIRAIEQEVKTNGVEVEEQWKLELEHSFQAEIKNLKMHKKKFSNEKYVLVRKPQNSSQQIHFVTKDTIKYLYYLSEKRFEKTELSYLTSIDKGDKRGKYTSAEKKLQELEKLCKEFGIEY